MKELFSGTPFSEGDRVVIKFTVVETSFNSGCARGEIAIVETVDFLTADNGLVTLRGKKGLFKSTIFRPATPKEVILHRLGITQVSLV